ncbi:hypothetical protein [Burkholderia multivorans]|uniref:hypothetical protein n=1 Tax=Burkholderia multivorans TaxID=87883 RepID=UPI0011864B5E|nr:hypothetical protein [Burkholderia multivorans]MBR8338459.1 hypothetical protein [Burkholderia multivorans]MBU9141515.1 hypothetical protein [Burkholderia multivorans]MBU9326327.1 hypothetical protein [Burkholderia multivorans]MBU9459217.1 hypothetical protein [Burkholderia multivorans]MBU9510917.1 hypothetical protein [Burkholderia multivorans]
MKKSLPDTMVCPSLLIAFVFKAKRQGNSRPPRSWSRPFANLDADEGQAPAQPVQLAGRSDTDTRNPHDWEKSILDLTPLI